ncbi:MAG: Tryptophan-tRNA ligase [Candidatus Magasanikbacteria bacterium GW2011_GWA2_45_39]|uniref:Tryptophan--tRNA ligase n=2 Tax=Candidatus Magasanikiibacteriota TaxID=1752731 RepID=A0A0G1Q6P6_9BACT|nr:MAG: Tryptophan-tRNA ligase [Candidatus Magasanikbacteria bacterium GW2011_GWA2_45_39]KKU13423.1 MAG: Tryptophan-tRNA ligase [Candidatus Magasanikbacteria bacterium GW2011_GWC2_45_8]HBW74058.1 tryptophan--tRNA ligase [Candidatus Magasanikbacteria bacterium]
MSRILSAVQPTNNLHIGNYLGAIKQWVELQEGNETLFFIVDLHALTVYQKPETLSQNILDVARMYLALGLNPNKSIMFVQSHVKEHAELAWILGTITKMGELERMTQFKDKSAQHANNINAGMFTYPVLMAADILLYDTEKVPVGEDQKQHVELTRDLAERFNKLYGKVFTVPEPLISKSGARIMGLDDPAKKMSKSAASAYNYISLLDDVQTVKKKIKKAVTDSGTEVMGGASRPALNNLLTIYSLFSGKSVSALEKEFAGKGYGNFKDGLADTLNAFLEEFQEKFHAIKESEVRDILADGAARAVARAALKMAQIKETIGLL